MSICLYLYFYIFSIKCIDAVFYLHFSGINLTRFYCYISVVNVWTPQKDTHQDDQLDHLIKNNNSLYFLISTSH